MDAPGSRYGGGYQGSAGSQMSESKNFNRHLYNHSLDPSGETLDKGDDSTSPSGANQ